MRTYISPLPGGYGRRSRQYSYAWFAEFLGTMPYRNLEPHQRVTYDGEDIVVSLHDMPFFFINERDTVRLDCQGHRTHLLKSRINHLLVPWGVRVYQASGLWYVRTKYADYVYQDGITFDGPSTVVLSGEIPEPDKPLRRRGAKIGP
jgi:hypothetical protein